MHILERQPNKQNRRKLKDKKRNFFLPLFCLEGNHKAFVCGRLKLIVGKQSSVSPPKYIVHVAN